MTHSIAVYPAVPIAIACSFVNASGTGTSHSGFHPRPLRVAAPVALAQAVAVDQHPVARREGVRSGFRHRSGQVDAADHGHRTADRRGTRDRQTVLVVQGGVLDVHQHVVVRQIGQRQVAQAGGVPVVDLVDDHGFERVAHLARAPGASDVRQVLSFPHESHTASPSVRSPEFRLAAPASPARGASPAARPLASRA